MNGDCCDFEISYCDFFFLAQRNDFLSEDIFPKLLASGGIELKASFEPYINKSRINKLLDSACSRELTWRQKADGLVFVI